MRGGSIECSVVRLRRQNMVSLLAVLMNTDLVEKSAPKVRNIGLGSLWTLSELLRHTIPDIHPEIFYHCR